MGLIRCTEKYVGYFNYFNYIDAAFASSLFENLIIFVLFIFHFYMKKVGSHFSLNVHMKLQIPGNEKTLVP